MSICSRRRQRGLDPCLRVAVTPGSQAGVLATREPDCSQLEMGCWHEVALSLPVSQPSMDLCMPRYLILPAT